MKRILLIRDTSLCPRAKGLLCDKLTGAALPNSRESVWSLWAGTCADSAKLPVPKAGKSFVRNGEAFDAWEYASPTPGIPNAFEKGVQDCRLEIENLTYSAKGWSGKWKLSGCDSVFISAHYSSLFSLADESWNGTLWRDRPQFFEVPLHAEAFHLQVQWPEDDVPGNDGLDSLFADAGSLPVRLTEVHPCPDEGIPEWFEIENVPFDKMLPDDKEWFPIVVAGGNVYGTVFLEEDLKHSINNIKVVSKDELECKIQNLYGSSKASEIAK